MAATPVLRLPRYLDGLLENWRLKPADLAKPETRSWVRRGLAVMLAAYDWCTEGPHGVIEQIRPRAYYVLEKKKIPVARQYLDVAKIAAETEADPRISFEKRLLAAAEEVRPLSPGLDRLVPLEEQQLLADVVFGRKEAVYERLDSDGRWLDRLYLRRHVITDALAYCPDPAFRQDFIHRYRGAINDRPKRQGLPAFWHYQARNIGFEGPGRQGSVFAGLITPDTPLPASDWSDRLLAIADDPKAVEGRIRTLLRKGVRRPKTAAPDNRRPEAGIMPAPGK